uniref:Clathrin coat assembly protein n=1 Tax=Talaromyces marneffei PM1 TaxID=1077442 RepID=A0A093XIL5_TALMA
MAGGRDDRTWRASHALTCFAAPANDHSTMWRSNRMRLLGSYSSYSNY